MNAHVQPPSGEAIPRFTLTPQIPVDKDFLREIQRIAMTAPGGCDVWGEAFQHKPEEEAFYFREKEWASSQYAPHRVDLYTVHRGLCKVFDLRQDLPIAMRQVVIRALFEQKARPIVLASLPQTCSEIVQLALFDQVVY